MIVGSATPRQAAVAAVLIAFASFIEFCYVFITCIVLVESNPLPNLRRSGSVLLKINKIENDVDEIKHNVKSLSQDTNALDFDQVKKVQH